jgi:micrococcal nuclease
VLRYKLIIGLLVLVIVALTVVVVRLAASEDRSQDAPTGTPQGTPQGPRSDDRPSGVPGDAEQAVVTDHVDGDTLRLRGSDGAELIATDQETTVRMLEIDTPESVAPGSPVDCYAPRASAALELLLPLDSEVWVAADAELLDPYDRVLLYVWDANGTFVNLEMVETGHARAVLYEPNDRYIRLMRRAEGRARSAGVGLWGRCEYFGQPRGLVGGPQPSQTAPPQEGTDPRFDTCTAAIDAGYGDYRKGRDPEYAWYVDSDGDGLVCER